MRSRNGFGYGTCVKVYGEKSEDLNRALRKLDKLLMRNGIRKETRRREYYVSKGEKRRKKSRFF